MGDPNADAWMAIFYGEGHMDVQLTNTLYEQRYGKAGTTVGYTNTVANPATGPNPSAMSLAAYNSTPVYTNAQGTQQGLPSQVSPAAAPQAPAAPTQPTAPTQNPTAGQSPTQNSGAQPTVGSTQDLLKEFLESDPDLILNYTANQFREMGASNLFMQWYVKSFPSFWGRYQGYVAEQALNGQIPTLTFTDFILGMDTQNMFFADRGPGQTQSGQWANFVNQQNAA